MYSIHRWSFRPGEKFQDVEKRYKSFLLHDIPPNTSSVHFCCDRYDHEPSLKAMERTRCTQTSTQKLYDIQNHLPTPAFREFVQAPANKAALQSFLSEAWCSPHASSPLPLYLSGGFVDETITSVVDANGARSIPELASTHEEADNRITLHALYSAEVLNANRIVIHANDTDVIILAIYYCATSAALTEVWVRTDPDTFIPIHDIARALGKEKCVLLPFFHTFSGKDDTSFIYGLGKRKLWKALKVIQEAPLKNFAENADSLVVSGDLVASCQALLVHALGGGDKTLTDLRTQKFLAAKSALLIILPPTEAGLLQHTKRSALATIISKSSHVAKPPPVDFTSYRWNSHGDELKPVYTTKSALPTNLERYVKCMCKKRCAGNCACSKNNVPCFMGCYCQGKAPKCTRALYMDSEGSDSE